MKMISLRFPNDLEAKLNEISQLENKTKTDILKDSFLLYIKSRESESSAYQLGKKYIGKYDSGQKDKSINHKKLIREKIRAKTRAKQHH